MVQRCRYIIAVLHRLAQRLSIFKFILPLWYLVAMLYGLLFFYLILRFVNQRWYIVIVCTLWMLQILWYTYNDVIPLLPERVKIYMDRAPVNGLTKMVPFLLTGWLVRIFKKTLRLKMRFCGLLISISCLRFWRLDLSVRIYLVS